VPYPFVGVCFSVVPPGTVVRHNIDGCREKCNISFTVNPEPRRGQYLVEPSFCTLGDIVLYLRVVVSFTSLRIASSKNHREHVSHCIIKNHSEMVCSVTALRERSWLVFPRSRACRIPMSRCRERGSMVPSWRRSRCKEVWGA